MAVQDNEGGTALRLFEYAERSMDQIDVVRVAPPQNVPSVTQEPGRNVLGECDARATLDRDVVVVVNPTEVIETEMRCQRCGLGRDAFHQAAVAADRINIVIEYVEARLVVAAGKPFLSNRHTDAGGDALSEGTGRRFDSGYPMIFRMSWRLAVELAKPTDVIE